MQSKESATTSCSIIYSLVPAHPLPAVDLSQSFRGRLLPARIHTSIRQKYCKYYREILLCAAVSYCLNAILPMVSASTGQILAILTVVLWAPLGLGSITTLRYDIVRLATRTFDFWFFSIITSVVSIMLWIYFGDIRSIRAVVDWVGYHHVLCVDAHVLGIKSVTYLLIASVVSAIIVFFWIIFGNVDGGSTFSVVKYQNMHGNFELSSLDVIGNGLVSLSFLLGKVIFRRRKALRLRRRKSTAIVECVIYRCKLKLEAEHNLRISTAWISNDSSKQNPSHPVNTVQHLLFVKFPHPFDSSSTLSPWGTAQVSFPAWLLVMLYTVGVIGLLLSHILLVHELFEAVETGFMELLELQGAVIALLCTLTFTTSFAVFYQRQLLKLLFSSFDFLFYSIQITAADICVCSLYGWDHPQCLMVLSWWLWAHWLFTLDALPPIMRNKLKLRLRYVGVILVILLVDHVALIYQIFLVTDTKLQESVIFEGRFLSRHVSIRVIPFYTGRSLTLLLWCSRLVARFGAASDSDVTILRGTVCYENLFVRRRRRSSQSTQVIPFKAPHGQKLSSRAVKG